jgi:Immunity protein Imm1
MVVAFDVWEGSLCETVELVDPEWSSVEDSIRRLDACRYTICVIDRGDLSNLSIGGGDGQFSVCLTTIEEDFFTVTNSERSSEQRTDLLVGGQVGLYPSNTVVPLESVLLAARQCFDDGSMTSQVDWCSG